MANDKSNDCEKKNLEKEDENNSIINSVCSMEERSEYFGRLEKWLYEAYAWQTFIAMFPYYVMSNPMINHLSGMSSFSTQISTNIGVATVTSAQQLISNNRQGNVPLRQIRPQEQNGPFQPPGVEGFEYRIPPVWKRFLAECIDSMMLFCLKLCVTFVAVDVFDFINVEAYDLDMLQKNLRIDYKMAIELTSGILILELFHRIMVCIFEAYWLQRGLNGRIGGATPGKSLMGLRVVQCRSVTPVDGQDNGEVVLVSPGTDLGLSLAFGRSLVKNLILAFLFPICFAIFFFRFNRTGYDLMCNSIVVEDPYRNRNNNNNRFHRR